MECLTVVQGINAYREYLSHKPFTVYTDHKALQWLNNMKDPFSRLGRWALKLHDYQYHVIHKDGKNNKHADALSRRPYDDSGTSVTAVNTITQGLTSHCQGQEPYSSLDDLLDPGAQGEGDANKDG